MKAAEAKDLSTRTRLAIDFGPLLIFFLANSYAPVAKADRIFVATAAFMLATAVAMIVSKWKSGSISVLLWFNGLVVALFGGLTLYLHDETFIKLKPTILYGMYAVLLLGGLAAGKPLLKLVLASAYPAMDDDGWRKLTRNWAWFFLVMAVMNEAVWRSVTTDQWVAFKTWIVTPLSFLFALAQAPLLMRHGLPAKAEPPVPPQG